MLEAVHAHGKQQAIGGLTHAKAFTGIYLDTWSDRVKTSSVELTNNVVDSPGSHTH